MNYKINETDDQVEVKVSVPRDVKNKVIINTEKVKEYLSENNISFYNCIQESLINNRHSKWSGTWIFSKKQPKKTIQKPVEENVENVVDSDSTNMIQSRSYSSSRRKKKKSYKKDIIENNDVE